MAEISVLIPVFNGARFVEAAIASAATQTHAPLEIIVVDDGSTDDSAERAVRTPARVIRTENRGPGAARNRAVAESRGDYLAFLDADDLWKPDKLAVQLAELRAHPELGWLVCRQQFLLDEGQSRPSWAPPPHTDPTLIAWLPSAILVHRDCFALSEGFDETLRYGEDLDWFARARDAGFPGGAVEGQLLTRRVHRTNLMHAHTPQDHARALLAIVARHRRKR